MKASQPESEKPYVPSEYPKYLVDPDGSGLIVQDREEEDRQEAVWRRETERRRFIERFAERQRSRRQWLRFSEIAHAHGLTAGPAGSPHYDQTRESALRLLSQFFLAGEFERAGRSRVLYLAADVSTPAWQWLKREEYRSALDATAPSAGQSTAPGSPRYTLGQLLAFA